MKNDTKRQRKNPWFEKGNEACWHAATNPPPSRAFPSYDVQSILWLVTSLSPSKPSK